MSEEKLATIKIKPQTRDTLKSVGKKGEITASQINLR